MNRKELFKKLSVCCFVTIFLLTIIAGCSSEDKKKEENSADESVVVEEESVGTIEAEENPIPEGKVQSPFNGQWIPEEKGNKRPVALQINNSTAAYPQSGITQADIIYETLAEGNITRLMAVFHIYDSEKIGPVRSARHYYLDMAANHDAVYMHYGGSPQAYSYIRQMNAPNMDGLSWLDGIVCWRDPERRSIPRMLEHSVYTNRAHLEDGWERRGLRTELEESFTSGLNFSTKETVPWGQRADYITIPYSASYTSSFDYDFETKIYTKYHSGELHMDEEAGKPLEFTNLIIQFTSINVIPGDDAGRREVAIIGSGDGYFISAGRAIAVEWHKADYASPTVYAEKKSGKPVTMNPGKTYIGILPKGKEISFH
ncbi:MAG: DUF3048 domain-containing protein [Tindallia sp. MSAO_Bac2]|nr:MAG: DUF3048 domain-containing protein [Tindallia sp. MSAO_Bac2]